MTSAPTFRLKGMLIVAGICFLSGLLGALWLSNFLNRYRLVVSTQPGALATAPVRTPVTLAETSPPPEGYHCGSARWPVKTLSDADAPSVHLTPISATVAELIKLDRPQTPLNLSIYDHRLAPVELTTYKVRGLVLFYKGEDDLDEHVVIGDLKDPNQTMITELVYWGCSGAITSKEREAFKKAKQDFLTLFDSSPAPQGSSH